MHRLLLALTVLSVAISAYAHPTDSDGVQYLPAGTSVRLVVPVNILPNSYVTSLQSGRRVLQTNDKRPACILVHTKSKSDRNLRPRVFSNVSVRPEASRSSFSFKIFVPSDPVVGVIDCYLNTAGAESIQWTIGRLREYLAEGGMQLEIPKPIDVNFEQTVSDIPTTTSI